MPRNQGSNNCSSYHYLLKKYVDDEKTQLEETRYFKTQGEIQELYSMKRCSIYCIINTEKYKDTKKRKYANFVIEKLSPPIPVYSQIETIPSGIVTN
tara:strand:+ start:114 stop:404 length:291 start_codon:yes stop_codon:yes gene_type:complete